MTSPRKNPQPPTSPQHFCEHLRKLHTTSCNVPLPTIKHWRRYVVAQVLYSANLCGICSQTLSRRTLNEVGLGMESTTSALTRLRTLNWQHSSKFRSTRMAPTVGQELSALGDLTPSIFINQSRRGQNKLHPCYLHSPLPWVVNNHVARLMAHEEKSICLAVKSTLLPATLYTLPAKVQWDLGT